MQLPAQCVRNWSRTITCTWNCRQEIPAHTRHLAHTRWIPYQEKLKEVYPNQQHLNLPVLQAKVSSLRVPRRQNCQYKSGRIGQGVVPRWGQLPASSGRSTSYTNDQQAGKFGVLPHSQSLQIPSAHLFWLLWILQAHNSWGIQLWNPRLLAPTQSFHANPCSIWMSLSSYLCLKSEFFYPQGVLPLYWAIQGGSRFCHTVSCLHIWVAMK